MTHNLEFMMLGRLLLAALLGGLVGLERQTHGRPAGLRTHILVCVGAALIMTGTLAFGPNVDPGRAVAGIVTGVGFLGAGVIVKSQDIVRGLTTAACIWFVAALGVVVGQGLYVLAAGSTVIAVIVLTLFGRVVHKIPSISYHTLKVAGAMESLPLLEDKVRASLSDARYRIVDLSMRASRSNDRAELTFRLQTRNGERPFDATKALLGLPEILEVEWM